MLTGIFILNRSVQLFQYLNYTLSLYVKKCPAGIIINELFVVLIYFVHIVDLLADFPDLFVVICLRHHRTQTRGSARLFYWSPHVFTDMKEVNWSPHVFTDMKEVNWSPHVFTDMKEVNWSPHVFTDMKEVNWSPHVFTDMKEVNWSPHLFTDMKEVNVHQAVCG